MNPASTTIENINESDIVLIKKHRSVNTLL
jgi:hypothetical protein